MVPLSSNLGMLLTLIVVTLVTAGCHAETGRLEAQQAFEQELERRQQRRMQANDLYEQGLAHYERSESERARRFLSQAVSVDERHADAWMALGVVLLEQEALFEAAKAFDQVSRLRPGRYEPHYNLGIVFESAGRYPQAIKAYERALDAAPDQTNVLENLARTYIAAGTNPERALNLVERALVAEHRPEWRTWLRRQTRQLEELLSRQPEGDQS